MNQATPATEPPSASGAADRADGPPACDGATDRLLSRFMASGAYRPPRPGDAARPGHARALLADLRAAQREERCFRFLLRPESAAPGAATVDEAWYGRSRPCDPRPEFRVGVYLRLRGALLANRGQAAASGVSTPRRRTRHPIWTLVAGAAAAVSVMAAWRSLSPLWPDPVPWTAGSDQEFSLAMAGAPGAAPPVFHPARSAVSADTGSPPPALSSVPAPMPPGQPPDTVFARNVERMEAGGGWRYLERADSAPMALGTRWRVARDSDTSIPRGFGTPDQRVLVFLQPGAEVAVLPEGLRIERGMLSVKTASDAPPVPLLVDGHVVTVEPGSRLVAVVAHPEGYAPGGEPAPRVYLDGDSLAFLHLPAGMAPLFPGREYRIDRYRTADLAGLPLHGSGFAVPPDDSAFPPWSAPGGGSELVAGPFRAANAWDADAGSLESRGYRYVHDAWLPPSYRGEPTVPLRRLSPEYIAFLRGNRDLAPVLAAARSVVAPAGGVYYHITD